MCIRDVHHLFAKSPSAFATGLIPRLAQIERIPWSDTTNGPNSQSMTTSGRPPNTCLSRPAYRLWHRATAAPNNQKATTIIT